MKQNITITLDAEAHKMLKEQAKARNMSMKKLGEEYFEIMVERLLEERKRKNTL